MLVDKGLNDQKTSLLREIYQCKCSSWHDKHISATNPGL